jgi:hypothetical protein
VLAAVEESMILNRRIIRTLKELHDLTDPGDEHDLCALLFDQMVGIEPLMIRNQRDFTAEFSRGMVRDLAEAPT